MFEVVARSRSIEPVVCHDVLLLLKHLDERKSTVVHETAIMVVDLVMSWLQDRDAVRKGRRVAVNLDRDARDGIA